MRTPEKKHGITAQMAIEAPTLRRSAKDEAPAVAPRSSGRKRAGEEGYILLAVLFMVAMVLIALSIAAPKVAADIQRDREIELEHRGKQYVRAVKLYYKKFGAYPPNMDALVKTNEIRFLRKKYKDPMTGKDDWHMIHFGENKTPSYGFFGQPLGGTGGSTIAGVGPGGVGQSIGSPAGGSSFGSSSFGGNSAGSGSFGSGSFGGSSAGASPTGGTGSNSGTGSSTDPNSGANSGSNGSTGSPTDGSNSSGSSTGSTGSSFMSGSSGDGQTFGGGGIIGVESLSPKPSILEYKKKKHYNEWEFWYDPNADRIMASSSSVGQSMGNAGNTSVQSPSQFNQPTGGSSIPPMTNSTTTNPSPQQQP